MKTFYQKYKSYYKDNLQLAIPVMISQLGQTTVQLSDTIVVGRFASKSDISLAAVSLANSVFIVVLVLGLGISNGLTPLVAQENGAKNSLACSRLLVNSLLVNIIIGLLLFAIVQTVNYEVLQHLGQNAVVVEHTKPFLSYLAYSVFPLMIFQTFKQFAEGLGFTKQAMQISIWGNILNIVLGIIFVKGMFGIAPMDVRGVGLSTLIDRVLMAICMSIFVLKSSYFTAYIENFNWQFIEKKIIFRILKIGTPVALQYTFEVSAFSGAAVIIGSISANQMAAHQIAISLASVTYMLAAGIAAAATIKSGNYFGAKNYQDLRKSAIASYHTVLLFYVAMALLFVIGNSALPHLFTQDNQVITFASSLLIIAGLFQLLDGTQVVGLGVLRGISDVNKPTLITFVAYWLFGLPIGYLLGVKLHMGAQGVWIGLSAGLGVAALLILLRFQKISKRLIARFGIEIFYK